MNKVRCEKSILTKCHYLPPNIFEKIKRYKSFINDTSKFTLLLTLPVQIRVIDLLPGKDTNMSEGYPRKLEI